MKTTFLSFLMMLSILKVYGQERTNREKMVFDKTSGILSKSTGWSNNTTIGEWVDYENVIENNKDYKTKYKTLQGSYMMSQREQSFTQVYTKTTSYKGIEYFVLIVEKWSGEYKYPSLKQDWFEYKQTIGYIYTKEEYQKLLNINSPTPIEIKTKHSVSMGDKYEKYDETLFLDLIQTELSKTPSSYSSDYIFPIMKSKEGGIRFYLPHYNFSFSKYDFSKEYFETDYDNFSKIIIK